MILKYSKRLLLNSRSLSPEFHFLLGNCEISRFGRLLSLEITQSMSRGAFIVLEGPDRAGKSTQVAMLLQALKERSVPVENLVFPNRSTALGGLINDYLTKRLELPLEVVHMLFSANRWEFKDKIRETLGAGTTLVVDRYAASGAAYNAATTGRPLQQCRALDAGLPKPDLVLYLEIGEGAQEARAEWGAERFERAETQRKVRQNFRELVEPESWSCVDASRPREEVHASILEKALAAIRDCKARPIGEL